MIYVETDKDREINPTYLEPGTSGSGIFVPGTGTRTVFLGPELQDGYREGALHPDLTYSQSPVLSDHFGRDAIRIAQQQALDIVGTRYNARFYETVLATLFHEEIDIKHIMTGVTTFTGEYYHDLGYIASRGSARG